MTRIIVAAGIIGIVLIALSGIKPSQSAASTSEPSEQLNFSDDGDEYKQQIMYELKDILEKIEGVGECEVMVSVESTAEYVYAENVERSADADSGGSNERYENEIVIIENNGGRQALVKKMIRPKVGGVVVVCGGGGNIVVKERVIKAVSAALNLPYGRICVEGKK